jgi:predicted AAA+ superfamily ATPase
MFRRCLPIPSSISETFFLWGPRQAGKTTFLLDRFPKALRYDLLLSSHYSRFTRRPQSLGEELLALRERPGLVVIDEIQKVPQLLDEVQRLMVEHGIVFGLCGSSARKLRRGHSNLLGGRALRFEMFGLTTAEVGDQRDVARFCRHGVLPRHFLSSHPAPAQRAYVEDYLRQEVAQEGLVRNLAAFHDFLRAAAMGDTEIVSYENIARECGVAAVTVKEHYQILVDTLLGSFVPAFTAREKRRVIRAPKFYFRDVGSVNALTRRQGLEPGQEIFGKAFENWICHELQAHAEYSGRHHEVRYWRLASGIEVDFILGDLETAVEVKATERVRPGHLRGLEQLKAEHPAVGPRILVCLEERPRRLDNGILVLPALEFLQRLWAGEILADER